MRFVIRKIPERNTDELEAALGDAFVYSDVAHVGALRSFIDVLRIVNDNAVYIQDDVVLCKDFKQRCEDFILQYPRSVIVFSSFFDSNNDVRNAFRDGAGVQTLCVFIPKYTAEAYLYSIDSGEWILTQKDRRGQFDDLNFGRWLVRYGFDIFVTYPNLAGHLPVRSSINKSRPANRLCKNFDYEDTAWNWKEAIASAKVNKT